MTISKPLRIIWTSWQRGNHCGYGTVWQELGSRLADYGVQPIEGFWEEDWDLAVFLGYPKAFLLGREEKRPDVVWHTMWETDKFPDDWVHVTNRAGMVWTPSAFCKNVMERGSITIPIEVSSYGVDTEVFAPVDRYGREMFTFMAMGRFFGGRKGVLRVLNAYLRLKSKKLLGDDTRLIIKVVELPWKEIIFEGEKRDDIELVSEKVSVSRLLNLYQACDVFVYPSSGEGLGLEPLEAMSTGACAIIGNWSGPTEYIRDDVCVPLPPTAVQPFPSEPFTGGNMAFYSDQDVMEKMLWCYENRDQARELGERASMYVQENWTWDLAAERGAALLKEYAESL